MEKETKQKIIEDLKRIVKEENCRAGEACGSERLKEYISNLEPKKTKCSHKEWEEYKGQKFCKECGDILSGELCLAPGCTRYMKPKGKICME